MTHREPLSINQAMPDTSLHGLKRYRANPPVEAQVRRNGRTPLSRVEAVLERQSRMVTEQRDQRINAVMDWAKKQKSNVDASLEDIAKQVQNYRKALRAGTVAPDEVLKAIPIAMQELQRSHKVLDEVDTRGQAALQLAEVEPADYQARILDRFPALRQNLPVITEDWLVGDDDRDPFGGA